MTDRAESAIEVSVNWTWCVLLCALMAGCVADDWRQTYERVAACQQEKKQ